MPRRPQLAVVLAAIVAAAVTAASSVAGATPTALSKPIGTVISDAPLAKKLWVPGTAQAFRLTYVTTDALGHKALSSGEVFVPKGTAPAGGWPVISWAHGPSGLSDSCAPSWVGPAEPARDFGYLANWMKQGYAIV